MKPEGGSVLRFSHIFSSSGRSSGFGKRWGEYGTSPFLRINQDGQLVGKHLDYFGSTDSLRLGMHLPRRFKEEQSLPDVKETELGVDFCLTWSTDPRWKQHSQKNCQKFSLSRTKLVPYDPTSRRTTATATTTPPDTDADLEWLEYEREKAAVEEEFIQRGPTHLLEAVYCDPCKAKVMDRGNKYSCLIPRFSAIT